MLEANTNCKRDAEHIASITVALLQYISCLSQFFNCPTGLNYMELERWKWSFF